MRCREYADKGRKGCDMPIIYTTELNQVVKQCCDEVIKVYIMPEILTSKKLCFNPNNLYYELLSNKLSRK